MSLPSVAIVGRPNVGKSSLLNAMVRRRVSIVHDRPGVTRDRIAVPMEHADRAFEVVDMGGIGIADDHDLESEVEMQINTAIQGASVLVFVVDARDGVTPLDIQVAHVIRTAGMPYLLVANKVDGERHRLQAHEFYSLGLGEPLPTSALEETGITDVLHDIVAKLPPALESERLTEAGEVLVGLVGQRNAGKSTLLNAWAGEERVIVSEVPGTTRDAIDVRISYGDRTFVAIDTAGIRKTRMLADSVEFYSQVRALETIRRAHVVILLIDAAREVSQVDKSIAQAILDSRKPCVLAINKWDAVENVQPDAYLPYLSERLPLLHYAPVVFVSAKSKTRIDALLKVSFDLHDQSAHRVPTPELNRIVQEASKVRGPRVGSGRSPKIYFATQVGVHPPWIVLFVNEPKLFKADFRRFLENRFRAAFPFKEIPLRISFRQRQSLKKD